MKFTIRLSAIILMSVVVGGGTHAQKEVSEVALPVEVANANAAFKTGVGARYRENYAVSRMLLPWIKTGMTKKEVESLLGPPDKDSGGYWFYTLFYSMFIEVRFDAQGTVLQVGSPLLSDLKRP